MLGEITFQPYAINTFSGNGRRMSTNFLEEYHYVRPHFVRAHFRSGNFVSGYWRDGDGDTGINRMMGYFARNPFTGKK